MGEVCHGYISCRKRKRKTEQEQIFSINITSNLIKLRNELLLGKYKPKPVRSFLIDKPVLREIFAPDFRDRVQQHFMAEKLEPLFEKEFIHDCYSCRKGKGTLFGIERLKRFIAQCSANYTRDCYVLMCDIKGYFMSIDRTRLWVNLEKFIREKYMGDDLEKLLWQVHTFLFSSPLNHTLVRGRRALWSELPDSKSVFVSCGAPKPNEYFGEYTEDMDLNGKGLTIGALPAQMFGNFYLTPFDHYCKSVEKLRFYGRYVDDFFVVHTDKEYLKKLVKVLAAYLDGMGLTLHPNKIRILHYKQGIPFLGAYIMGRAVLPGKRIQGGFNRLLREIDHLPDSLAYEKDIERYTARLNSYLGMMQHYNARMYIRNMLDRHPRIKKFFRIDDDLSKAVSHWKIRDDVHKHILKKTNHLYHEQFRRDRKQTDFKDRTTIYNAIT